MKTALIFGVTGQDGSYLAELLLGKGYRVIGVSRRTSTPNLGRLRQLGEHPHFSVIRGDVTDPLCVFRCLSRAAVAWLHDFENVRDVHCTEVYNLAAQSHVGDSFEEPSHTTQATYLGCLNILEAIRSNGFYKDCIRFYQASSSEMFGVAFSVYDGGRQDCPGPHWMGKPFQDECTPMLPCSPYAIAKLAAHHICRVYRESYGIFACSGILFNHESPRRGEDFVTRKITRWLRQLRLTFHLEERTPIKELLQNNLHLRIKLGNLDARRDWGYAPDYVRAMWLMLQQDKPDDYVIATGETHSVREFLEEALRAAGFDGLKAEDVVEVDQTLLRPSEVPFLRGDAEKAQRELGWSPTVTFKGLVETMVRAEGEECC